MIYLVIDDKGYLEQMFSSRSAAELYIEKNGNEKYTIDEEEMC